jgi:hypothetical protein
MIPINRSGGRVWASLPSKPVLDREGRQAVVDGRKQYVAILRWPNRDLADRWSDAVVALVRKTDPGALDDGS